MQNPADVNDATAKKARRPRRLLDAQTLKDFLPFIGSERQAHDFNRAPEKKKLCHYTDLGGLQGIVDKHDLWLTHARFSNDNRELLYGYDVAHEVLAEELKKNPQEKALLEEVIKLLDPAEPESVYICCFCESDNLLSQWRAYGANGTGVSITVEAKEFSWVTGDDTPLDTGMMRLWKIYYDPSDQHALIGDAVKYGRDSRHDGMSIEQKARKTADAIEFFIPTFKHRDFREEAEWRLIFTPGLKCEAELKFRVARQILVPYYSLRDLIDLRPNAGMKELPICQVLVGPSPRGSLNKESAGMLLEKARYNVLVLASDTSFRA